VILRGILLPALDLGLACFGLLRTPRASAMHHEHREAQAQAKDATYLLGLATLEIAALRTALEREKDATLSAERRAAISAPPMDYQRALDDARDAMLAVTHALRCGPTEPPAEAAGRVVTENDALRADSEALKSRIQALMADLGRRRA
jgi:hypothetical protein